MNENILFVIFYDPVSKDFFISVFLFVVLVILYSLLLEKLMSLIRFVCECDYLYTAGNKSEKFYKEDARFARRNRLI